MRTSLSRSSPGNLRRYPEMLPYFIHTLTRQTGNSVMSAPSKGTIFLWRSLSHSIASSQNFC